MIFSIFLTLVIFALIISFTGGEEFSQWLALGLLYVLFFNNKDAQIAKLNTEIEKLKKIVGVKDDVPAESATAQPVQKDTPVKPEKPVCQPATVAKSVPTATTVVRRPQPAQTPKPKESSGSFFGQNLIVWIAGFAAILGAFYLIRYSVEHGILGPRVRFVLTTLFGLALTFVGYVLYGIDNFANNKRIGQALTGAGLATLYFAAYAVSEIYHFTSQGMSFIWMCVVTGMAVILTIIRGGKPIALLTMLGVFLTPALVGGQQASPCFFSLYMLLFIGVFAWMAVEMASVLLLILAIFGLYLWSFYWLFFGSGALISFWQMIMLFGATGIFLRASVCFSAKHQTALQIWSVIACFFFGFGYVIRMKFGLMEWAVIGVMTAGLTALTFKDMKNYLLLLAGSVVAGLLIWTLPHQEKSLPVFIGYAAVALVPFYCSLWLRAKAVFSAYVGIFALLFYAAYCYIFKFGDIQTFVGLLGAVLLLLPMFRYKLETAELQQAAGITLLAAAVMAAVALSKLLNADVLPLIAAGGVLLFAVVGHLSRTQYTLYGMGMAFVWFVYLLLKPIAYVMAFLFIGSVWKMSISIEAVSFANILTYGLLPLICFGGTMFMLPKGEAKRVMFFSVAVLAIGSLFACYARIALAVLGSLSYQPGFVVHAIITDLLIASYWFVAKKGSGSPVLSGIGFWRLGLVCLTLLFGITPFALGFGSVIIGFGVPLMLFIWLAAISGNDRDFLSKCALFCSFYFVTLFVTLLLLNGETVKLFATHISDGGIFAYSAGWMVLGIMWLAAAMYNRKIAKPAFALIYFVIAKVFLYDVAELSDFWRIIALFALAGSLLGIGHFHAKFFKEKA